MIAARAYGGVGVAFPAYQLDEGALLPHQPNEFLRAEPSALVIVGHDLRNGDAVGVDLAVDQKRRYTRGFRLADGGDGGVGPGVIEHDGGRLVGDGHVDQLVLLVGVVIVRVHRRFVAQLFRPRRRGLGLRFEKRVVVGRGDDGDQFLPGCGLVARAAPGGPHGAQRDRPRCDASKVHFSSSARRPRDSEYFCCI